MAHVSYRSRGQGHRTTGCLPSRSPDPTGRAGVHGPFSSPTPRQSTRPRAPEARQRHWQGWHRRGGEALWLSQCSLRSAATCSQPVGAHPASLGYLPGSGSLGQGRALCLKEPSALRAPVDPSPRRPLALCPDTLGKEGPAAPRAHGSGLGAWHLGPIPKPSELPAPLLQSSLLGASFQVSGCGQVGCQGLADRRHSACGAATAVSLPELVFR